MLFARDLCNTTQHFVYTRESSVHRSEQTVFVAQVTLPCSKHQESIHHWLSDRIFHLQLHLNQSSTMGMCSLQLLCPGSFSAIQTASDYSWHQDPNFLVKMSLWNCHMFVPNLRAIQPNSSHHSIHHNSGHHSNRQDSSHHATKNSPWDTSVQIPEFLSLSLISDSQDLRDRLSMCCPCVRLWHLGSHFWFVWIFLWMSLVYLTLTFA